MNKNEARTKRKKATYHPSTALEQNEAVDFLVKECVFLYQELICQVRPANSAKNLNKWMKTLIMVISLIFRLPYYIFSKSFPARNIHAESESEPSKKVK